MLNHNLNSIAKKEIQIQFFAEVEFGVPSKDCINFGICRINPIGSVERKANCKNCKLCLNKLAKAVVTIFNDKHIELDFLRSTISQKAYGENFSGINFCVQECYEGFYQKKNAFKIPKGFYPFKINDRFITISIKWN